MDACSLGLDAAAVLGLVRPLVLVVDGFGQIAGAYGGMDGFLGHVTGSLVGRNVLDLVAPSEHEEVASYFVAQGADEVRTTVLPMPFRVRVIGAAGDEQLVDVIATGRTLEGDAIGWVVVLVPLAMEASVARSLDAELAGATHDHVKQLLAEELEVNDPGWCTRVFLVEFTDDAPLVIGSRSDDFGLRSITRPRSLPDGSRGTTSATA